MATNPALRRAIRLIAGAVHGFVKSKGWNPNGYRLFYRADEQWGHIHVIFVAPELSTGDYYSNYSELGKYLKNELQDTPGLFESLGIVLMTERQVSQGGIYSLGPEYADFADEFVDYWSFSPSKH